MSVNPNAVVGYVVFTPADPVLAATTNIRNMVGQDGVGALTPGVPARINAGQYRVLLGGAFVRTECSVTCGSSTAVAGGAATDRNVTVLFSAPGVQETVIDIMIRTDAGVLVDTETQVEVTIERLPPKQN